MELPTTVLPATSIQNFSRETWVEMQLIHAFMRRVRPVLHSAVVLIALMVVILHGHVDAISLALWATAAVVTTLIRYTIINIYQRSLTTASGLPLRAFMARYAWIWFLSGLTTGASMFVFFLKAPIYDQFICMMVLVCMAGFALGIFSSCLPCFIGYINGMSISVLAALAYQLFMEGGIPSTFNTYGVLALVFIYWAALRVSGKRFHEVQRSNLELQFDNSELIASLTEQSRAALEAVQIKNRFIASAAHDLRQPVHALDLYAGWLVAEPEFVTQIAPKIVRSIKAVNDLFDSLFDLAGLDSDPLRVHLQQIDLAGFIQDLEVQYVPLAHERGLRLRTRAVQGQVVTSDPVLLKRLVGNLLSNALKNTRQGGILLAMRRRHSVWCIEVWDTGVGIAKEHQKAIFQEFYRIPLPGTEEGFGLGLAIVTRLSEVLGHPVGMASRPGKGSVFWVELHTPSSGVPH